MNTNPDEDIAAVAKLILATPTENPANFSRDLSTCEIRSDIDMRAALRLKAARWLVENTDLTFMLANRIGYALYDSIQASNSFLKKCTQADIFASELPYEALEERICIELANRLELNELLTLRNTLKQAYSLDLLDKFYEVATPSTDILLHKVDRAQLKVAVQSTAKEISSEGNPTQALGSLLNNIIYKNKALETALKHFYSEEEALLLYKKNTDSETQDYREKFDMALKVAKLSNFNEFYTRLLEATIIRVFQTSLTPNEDLHISKNVKKEILASFINELNTEEIYRICAHDLAKEFTIDELETFHKIFKNPNFTQAQAGLNKVIKKISEDAIKDFKESDLGQLPSLDNLFNLGYVRLFTAKDKKVETEI